MLTQPIQSFLDSYERYADKKSAETTETYIHVDEIAAKVARFYEKTRNLIDYQEEHLLRKDAIKRALQQGMLFRTSDAKIAEPLVKKIIRAGHLPNDAIPERKIGEVQQIINNLLSLVGYLKETRLPASERADVVDWLLWMTVLAIEESLAPPVYDRLLAELMFQTIRKDLAVTGRKVHESDKDLQLFIAVQRTLLRADKDQINYRLLKFSYPNWNTLSLEELTEIAKDLPTVRRNIGFHLTHPLRAAFVKLCNHYKTVFHLIGDVVFKTKKRNGDIRTVLADDERLVINVQEAYKNRRQNARKQLARLAVFSVISVFLSKVLIALAIEIPIDKYVTGDYSTMNTLINIIAPPILMVLILSFVRLPSKKNWALVIKEVRSAVLNGTKKEYPMKIPKRKSIIADVTAWVLYFLLSVGIFFTVAKTLRDFGFSAANIVVFILFTSLVAATGIKIFNRSKELSLEKEKHTFLTFIFDLLIMPFVSVGKWLLAGLAKFKLLVLIANLVDLPFHIFVGFIENLREFIRSKKEELY